MVEISFPVVPEANNQILSEKQLVDYRSHRRDFIEWLLVYGKDPKTYSGYSRDTVKRTAYRCGKFDRFIWEKEGRYSAPLNHDHAETYIDHMAYEGHSKSHLHNTQLALIRYFKWLSQERGGDAWEPDVTFSSGERQQAPDYLSRRERQLIRQAALDYGSIPTYSTLSPAERTRWKNYVSQRLRKPLNEVVPDDWDQVNGWKFTSLVWTSLDTGLRPVEVRRATIGWVDIDNHVLRIPKSESAKGEENWLVSISDRTAEALDQWLTERDQYSLYDDTEALWLTREGNPYSPQSLRRLLIRLCEDADIKTTNRKMSWYAIRHSLGTYMTAERDLKAAQSQLRHKSPQTTMRYDQTPVEDRKEALERIG